MATYDELMNQATQIEAVPYSQVPLIDKENLLGQSFVVTGYHTYPSKFDESRRFAAVTIVLPDDTERVFVDGGAAILPVLEQATFPLYAPNGLGRGKNGKTWIFTDAQVNNIDPNDIPF